jgi:hypothetical protein
MTSIFYDPVMEPYAEAAERILKEQAKRAAKARVRPPSKAKEAVEQPAPPARKLTKPSLVWVNPDPPL